MHIHTTQASATGNALASAQAAETAISLRRARELRDAATKLKAASFDFGSGIPADTLSDPQTQSQSASLVGAWTSGSAASSQFGLAIQDSVEQRSSADSQLTRTPPQIQEVQLTPASGPISYWA